MKKLALLLVSGAVAFAGSAQQNAPSLISTSENQLPGKLDKHYEKMDLPRSTTAKKTTATTRVYSWSHQFDTTLVDNLGLGIGYTGLVMWQDSIQNGQYTSGLQHINMVSCASILDPSTPGFNSSVYYPGEMMISPTDAYTVTAVDIYGVYDYNPAKTSVVDTIVLAFSKGAGTGSDDIVPGSLGTGGHYSSATFVSPIWDSVLNSTRNGVAWGTTPTYMEKIVLDNSGATPAWGDTSSTGIWHKTVTLSTPIPVAANNMVAISISFRSGDAALPTTLPGDTIFYNTGVNKYNMFRPLVGYASDGSGNVQWAPYSTSPLDSNVGAFKKLPGYANGWANIYIPLWAWSSSGTTSGASSLQYPVVDWTIDCPACGLVPTLTVKNANLVSNLNVFPNPAANQLNINFNLSAQAQVNVSLLNMLGQVVKTQSVNGSASGNIVFNTADLANGIYSYVVSANGQKTTGRVSIVH